MDISLCLLVMSHNLLSRHIVLMTVGVYSSKRFKKSVDPSVCSFVTLTRKAYSSFIIDSRKIICLSGERAYHPPQENEAIFSKKYFSKMLVNFRKILHLHKMPTPSL